MNKRRRDRLDGIVNRINKAMDDIDAVKVCVIAALGDFEQVMADERKARGVLLDSMSPTKDKEDA